MNMHPLMRQRHNMVKHAAADDGEMLRYIGEIEEVLAQVGAEKGASDPVSKFLDYCADARRVIEDSSGTTVDGNSIRQQIAEGFNGMREILEIALSEIGAPEDQKRSRNAQNGSRSERIKNTVRHNI